MASSIPDTNGATPPKPNNKIFLRGLPAEPDWEELKTLVSSFAPVQSFHQAGNPDHPAAIVTLESADDATNAITKLNNHDFMDNTLKATMYAEKKGRGRRMGSGGDGRSGPQAADMPLRMVVDARFVGAIIGQGGANIREITRESKARCVVDVNRGVRDQSGATEKVINIYGQPENSSKAALRILAVVQKEAAKEADGKLPDPELKLRAHNQLVGRLIGKGGATIKKIMEDTSTTIIVSNDANAVMAGAGGRGGAYADITGVFSMERTITIRGALEAIASAEEKISGKLRQCWENDMMNAPHMSYAAPHPLIPPGMPPDAAFQNVGFPGAVPFQQQPFQPGQGGRGPAPLVESVHLYVPNSIVGALIGAKGVHIRNVMRITGAQIRIEAGVKGPSGDAKSGNGNGKAPEDDRLVIINGTDQQQYKAQFWIYQRVCEQGFVYFDEVRLVTEVAVPTKLVGRIIGKQGQNVRELQRMTGASVRIPETPDDDAEETIVRITANFHASQAVQARIRQLVINHNIHAPGAAPRNE